MSKPDWCPQDVWDGADIVGERIHGRHVRGWVVWPLITEDGKPAQEIIARAILAAEKRGEEREREAIEALLTHGAPHSPRRYIYDNTADRRIWACDQLDETIRARSIP